MQHMAGKKLFYALDCSQLYHWIQISDEQSLHFISFTFVSRTLAYQHLLQSFNRSFSISTYVIREYLDPLLKADQRTQYEKGIGVASQTASELTNNVDFKKFQKPSLRWF